MVINTHKLGYVDIISSLLKKISSKSLEIIFSAFCPQFLQIGLGVRQLPFPDYAHDA